MNHGSLLSVSGLSASTFKLGEINFLLWGGGGGDLERLQKSYTESHLTLKYNVCTK